MRFRRKPLVPFFSSMVAVAGLVTGPAQTLQAFCPTNGIKCAFGGVGQTHKDITVDAVTDLDKEFFSVTKLTKGMKKAISQISDANAAVDDDQMTAAKHFDGETFASGHARLVTLFDGVISALQAEDAAGARSQLGGALHTVQDFYAHSNWIERGGGGPATGTWRAGESVSPVSPPGEASCAFCLNPCSDCGGNLVTANITSGYYGGEDTPKPIPAKCNHGGPFDSLSAGGGGINKDTSLCDFSPHSNLHSAAAGVAKDATNQFIRDLKDRITFRQLKLLLGVGPTLAMSIDTTGSMGSVIAGVRTQAIQIVNQRLGTDEEPLQYVLAPFNDPSTGPLTLTGDADQFKAAIGALFASAGGDCPELSMTGALQALQAADEGIDLFTFTDASAKDSSLSGAVSSLASKKDAKIYPILFGSCSPIDPAYIRLARDTGGQLFFLRRDEAGRIATLADFVVRSNAVDVLSVADTLTGTRTLDVPVDSTLSRVTFSASGTTGMVLKRPDGTIVQGTDPGVGLLALSTGAVYSIVGPARGSWNVTLNGSGDFSLNVSGESSLGLDGFRFVELGGRIGHQGLYPIAGFPVIGQTTKVNAEMSGDLASAAFELRSKAGAMLQSVSLSPDTPGSHEFFGEIALPNVPFLVYATGSDAAGSPYQRLLAGLIQPQTVKIVAPLARDLVVGQTTTYVFEVQNLGGADSFRFSATDGEGFVSGVSPAVFTLGANQTAPVTVTLVVPPNARPGALDMLTVTVEGNSGARNFAVVRSLVTANRAPDCSQAHADSALLWPPNHRMSEVRVLGLTDPDGDVLSVQVQGVAQDEPTNGPGDGNTCPDAQGIGTGSAQLRAERSGTGDGRVYSVTFSAADGRGGACQGRITVCVPHNNRGSCVDGGPTFDSAACPVP